MAKTQESNVVAGAVGEMSLLLAEDQTGDQPQSQLREPDQVLPQLQRPLAQLRLEGRGSEFSSASALLTFVLGILVPLQSYTQSHTSQAPASSTPNTLLDGPSHPSFPATSGEGPARPAPPLTTPPVLPSTRATWLMMDVA